MKKLNLIAFVAVLFMAVSCEKDLQGGTLTINAKVVNGNDYNELIDEVKAFTKGSVYGYFGIIINYEVMSTKYADGSFSMVLPKTLNPDAFSGSSNDGEHTYAIIPYCYFFAYKENICVGEFIYKSNSYSTSFIYRDGRPKYVVQDGEAHVRQNVDDIGYNIKIKKGWSTIYWAKDGVPSLKMPNEELKWYFIPN
ncbi:MAG: hypothetical protein LBN95_03930 [Prevotellaceae bacterium]|jgi:hypothetical protein|nr:hypothetical protein [Prevotellaceae bacterium]